MRNKFWRLKNESGQMGIFVALIFQIIFIFFAIIINVGLIVHHKINLQQSTDLAAYYGAMKQAEMLNAISHVNYQIRQAFKLFTWRYRVYGTFGVEDDTTGGINPASNLEFPFTWSQTNNNFEITPNPLMADKKCAVAGSANGYNFFDLPFMCMMHSGYREWSISNMSESMCKVDCHRMNGTQFFKIPNISPPPMVYNAGGMTTQITNLIGSANTSTTQICNKSGPTTVYNFVNYYMSYRLEMKNRAAFIRLLGKNLESDPNNMLDIRGEKVIDGVSNTFNNNLTEANLTSISKLGANAIQAMNSIQSCDTNSQGSKFLNEVKIEVLKAYLIFCELDVGNNKNYKVGDIDFLNNNILQTQVNNFFGAGSDIVKNIEYALAEFAGANQDSATFGFEKNPWCPVYYGVKASSEPKIPFLPLVKVKLHAVSFAKPFGGSIGPWYFDQWPSGQELSGTNDYTRRIDKNSPYDKPPASLSGLNPTLADALNVIPNHSLFVGDSRGWRDPNKVAPYTYFLIAKNTPTNTLPVSDNKFNEPDKDKFKRPLNWPSFAHHEHLLKPLDDNLYDALARDNTNPNNPRNSYLRDIEISVISPDQFDVSYYSIDPNFKSNYLLGSGKLADPTVLQKFQSEFGGGGSPPVPPWDFGDAVKNNLPPLNGVDGNVNFSVKNQIQITKKIFKDNIPSLTKLSTYSSQFFNYKVNLQSTLLTSWTYLNLLDFSTFPSPGSNSVDDNYPMKFATCSENLNPWMADYQEPTNIDSKYPPAQGNCVTGGRTGYSVKLISAEAYKLGKTHRGIGGPSQDGQIQNPIDPGFVSF